MKKIVPGHRHSHRRAGNEPRRRSVWRLITWLVRGSFAIVSLYYLKWLLSSHARQRQLSLERKKAEASPRLDLKGENKDILQELLMKKKDEIVKYQDEISLPQLARTITTPFDGELEDYHTVVNASCPRYVTMEKPCHGLGHQMGSFTTALITSVFFNLTYVDAPFSDETFHGDYPDMAAFTGLREGEHRLEDVVKQVDKVIEVKDMPKFPTSKDIRVLYEPLRKAFRETYAKECNVLFMLQEYYSYDYDSFTKTIVAEKFNRAPDRGPIKLLYSPDEFTIAIHIRVGDITPTSEAYFVRLLSEILPILREGDERDFPFRIHVFAEKMGSKDFPQLVQAVDGLLGKTWSWLGQPASSRRRSSSRLLFHPDLPAFDTFYHLTRAHVLLMSASGFSQFAAIVSTTPLVFSPPSREAFPLKFCPLYAVCCREDGALDGTGAAEGEGGRRRLQRRKAKWLRARQLQKDIKELEDALALTASEGGEERRRREQG